MLGKIKEVINLQKYYKDWRKILKKVKHKNGKKIILIGTPIHGNLGDHAIAEEEKIFLKDYFSEYYLLEIVMPMYKLFKKYLKKYIRSTDIIVISGGGWLGNLWLHNEIVVREIIKSYPNNQIVILPQTIFYTKDELGKIEEKKMIEVLETHSNLQLFLRDKSSYDYAKEKYLKTKVYYSPDIVLYGKLVYKIVLEKKDIIKICLREDRESILADRIQLINKIEEKYKVEKVTTVLNKMVSFEKRNEEIKNKWAEFSEAKLIITDRLHAMIFAVRNGVPCIILDNKTGKVFGVYQWLKGKYLIECASSSQEVLELIEKIEQRETKEYDNKLLKSEFDKMAIEIKKGIIKV